MTKQLHNVNFRQLVKLSRLFHDSNYTEPINIERLQVTLNRRQVENSPKLKRVLLPFPFKETKSTSDSIYAVYSTKAISCSEFSELVVALIHHEANNIMLLKQNKKVKGTKLYPEKYFLDAYSDLLYQLCKRHSSSLTSNPYLKELVDHLYQAAYGLDIALSEKQKEKNVKTIFPEYDPFSSENLNIKSQYEFVNTLHKQKITLMDETYDHPKEISVEETKSVPSAKYTLRLAKTLSEENIPTPEEEIIEMAEIEYLSDIIYPHSFTERYQQN